MAIIHGMCESFFLELLRGTHDLRTDVIKMALYGSSAELDPGSTTAYTSTGEITATNYTAGGTTLTQVAPALTSGVAVVDFADPTWNSSDITAYGALIYNSSKSDKAIMILNFGAARTSSGSSFTVIMPTADSTSAILRLGSWYNLG